MNDLQRIFEKATRQFKQPANIIGRMIATKLRKRGVKLSEAERAKVGRLAYRRLWENKSSFDLGIKRKKKVVRIRLGSKDFDGALKALSRTYERVIPEVGRDTARFLYRGIKRGSAISLTTEKLVHEQFARRLHRRWGKALDGLRLFIAVAREIGAASHEHLNRAKFRDRRFLIASLSRLHGRACQVAGEVDALLRAGYADGAHARWRTLHEISVVAQLLRKHGEAVAERYWNHVHVEALRGADQLNKHAAMLGERRFSKRELAKMASEVDKQCQRFGDSYRRSHGWACPLFTSNNDPKFSHLEEIAEFDHLRPYYKMASHNVHAEAKGATFRIGLLPGSEEIILAGPSNAGLEQPGRWTAFSLLNVTYPLLSIDETLDAIVYGQLLMMLKDEVNRHFYAAATKLQSDEDKIAGKHRKER